MKNKERKELAEKIAKLELLIQSSDDPKIRSQSEQDIMKITNKVKNFEDIMIIDEMVMDILDKNKK